MQRRARRSKNEGENEDRYGHREHGRRQSTREKHHVRNGSDEKLDTSLGLLKDKMKEPMNGDESYVRRWLEGTSPEGITAHYEPKQQSSRQIADSKYDSSRIQRQPAYLEPIHESRKPSHKLERLKRRRNSSSDSSILPAPIEVVSTKQSPSGHGAGEQQGRQHGTTKRRRSKSPTLITTFPHARAHRKETFEKRARHKTREDRYEPKTKSPKLEKDTKEKEKDINRTTSKRMKKSDRSKLKKDGGELMRNFSSKSIGQERLTMRPSYGLGLFRNGRTSDHAVNGVPDLAFSEMDSLRNSERNRHTTEMELAVAKSRQKETRKASKPVEDISAFVNQFRKPLHEIDLSNGQRTFLPTAETEATTGGDTNNTSLDKYASSERVSLPRRTASESVLEVPRRPSSYVSWSETQYSRNKSMEHPRRRSMHHPASKTPESVKRSLEATGIFVDTGIEDEHPYTRSFTEDLPQMERHRRHELLKHGQTISRVSETSFEDQLPRNPASSSVPRRRQYGNRGPRNSTPEWKEDKPQQSDRSHHPYEDHQPPQSDRHGTTTHHQSVDRARHNNVRLDEVSRPQSNEGGVIVKQFDKDLGCHQEPSSSSHNNTSIRPFSASNVPETVDTRRPSREELAKRARIKRPATTLPAVQPNRLGDQTVATKHSTSAERAQDSEIHTSIANPSQLPPPTVQPLCPTIQKQNETDNMSPSRRSDSSHHTTLSDRVARIERGLAQQRIPPPVATAQMQQAPSLMSPPSHAPPTDLTTKLGLPVRGGMSYHIAPRPRSSLLHHTNSLFWRQAHHEDNYRFHSPVRVISGINDTNEHPSQLATNCPYFNDPQLDSMNFQHDEYIEEDRGEDHMYNHEYEDTILGHEDLSPEQQIDSWQIDNGYEDYPLAEHTANEQQIDNSWDEYNQPNNRQQFFEPGPYDLEEANHGIHPQRNLEDGMYIDEQPFLDVNREYW